MPLIASILIGLIALLHLYFAWFEIFAWETRGPKIFPGLDADLFPRTKELAANQGIYNAFLSAGLIWSLLISDPHWARNIAVCFLLFVFVAGLFGGYTIGIKPLLAQTLPATIALAVIFVRF